MDGASEAYGAIGEATVLGAANTLRRAASGKIHVHHCRRCEHRWAGRRNCRSPRCCPACRSPYWSKQRKNKLREKEAMG